MSRLLPWQSDLWQRLNAQQAEGRLPHALLFSGPKGVGKEPFARFLGSALLCNAPTSVGPCGECRACQLLASDTHPDLLHLSPEEEGKVIKVDQVRAMIDRLHGTAQQGGYRVLVVSPAEEMNTSAANALLKTLEEPGADTLIILVVHQLGQVMPTLRSRCQRIEFALPNFQLARDWLSQDTEIEIQAAEGLMHIAQGAPLLAREWHARGALELRAQFMSGLADILRGRDTPLAVAEKLQKEDLLLILNWWISLLNDIVKMKLAQVTEPQVNADLRKMATALAGRVAVSALFDFCDRLLEERKGLLLHANPNRQLLLEKLLLGWKAL